MKWFQVDSDTPHDPKIRALLRRFGPEGFGGLVLLWCHIADHGAKPGRSLDSSGDPMPIEDLVDASHLDRAKFDEIVAFLCDLGHFARDAWDTRQEIVIPAMRRRADTYTRRILRRKSARSSNTVRSEFGNKTVQDSTYKEIPPTPLSAKGGRLTRAELKHAREVRARVYGRCPHDPKCKTADACVRAIAAEIRAKAS